MFLNYSTCFERHTAHNQELKNCNCSLWFYIRLWLPAAAVRIDQMSQKLTLKKYYKMLNIFPTCHFGFFCKNFIWQCHFLRLYSCINPFISQSVWWQFHSLFQTEFCTCEIYCFLFQLPANSLFPYYLYNYALQPLKAYCAILVRRSNFRHQASPRVSPRESTQRRKVKLWARNVR